MARLVKSPQAERDLLDTWQHIAIDSIIAADKVVKTIIEKIKTLEDYPRLGRARDDLREGLRCYAVVPYLIIYQYDEASDLVNVIRVLHGARDLPPLFEDED